MNSHEHINQRSLWLARAIVSRVDSDPERSGLAKAREVCQRWNKREPVAAVREWLAILDHPWEEVRRVLLDVSEEGKRLRQSNPFCGVLTPQERWKVYKTYKEDETHST